MSERASIQKGEGLKLEDINLEKEKKNVKKKKYIILMLLNIKNPTRHSQIDIRFTLLKRSVSGLC